MRRPMKSRSFPESRSPAGARIDARTPSTRSHPKLWVADQACKTEPRPLGSGDAPCGVPVGDRFLTGAVRITHKNRCDGTLVHGGAALAHATQDRMHPGAHPAGLTTPLDWLDVRRSDEGGPGSTPYACLKTEALT